MVQILHFQGVSKAMNMDWKLLCLLSSVLTSVLSIQVKTNNGVLEGDTIKLFNGKSVNIFFGVPYAAPPLGENRFAPPQPLQPWNGTLQAKSKRDGCRQAASPSEKRDIWFMSDLPESEDCLYMNIWAPIPSASEKFAVLFWFFSGGFTAGSANLPLYDGSILATEKNVIVITVNFRLSLFGFTYLNSSEMPGNMGLQDQIQALQWVNENIENFGGDSKRITLFGESAGSIAVGLHLTNMKIAGLFQNGIMESGSINMKIITSSEEQALNSTMELVRSVNCLSPNKQEILKCLRSKTPDELLANYVKGWPKFLVFPFTPVRNGIEVPLDTSKISVPKDKRKNVMGGDIPRELNYLIDYFVYDKELNEDMTISEDELRVSLSDGFGLSNRTLQDVVISLYKNYDGTYKKSQVRIETTEIFTDAAMICPQIDFSKSWVSEYAHVYFYYFGYRASTRTKKPVPEWVGAVHGEEVPFVYGAPLDRRNNYTNYEKKLSKQMMTFWSNFAKTGNPNGAGDKGIWPEVTSDGQLRYLDITQKLKPKTALKEKECDFWTNIFPGIINIQDKIN